MNFSNTYVCNILKRIEMSQIMFSSVNKVLVLIDYK